VNDTQKTAGQVLAIGGVTAAVFFGLGKLSQEVIQNAALPPLPTITLGWKDALTPEAIAEGWVTEFHETADLQSFRFYGVTTSNRFTVPTTNTSGFLICRHSNTVSGQVTRWNVK